MEIQDKSIVQIMGRIYLEFLQECDWWQGVTLNLTNLIKKIEWKEERKKFREVKLKKGL